MKNLIAIILTFVIFVTGCGMPCEAVARETQMFCSMADEGLPRYMEDSIYFDIVDKLEELEKITGKKYYVQDIQAQYISNEYLQELEFNSQKNVYFGKTWSELEQQFQGKKFVFYVDNDGKTAVKEFEKYDDTTDRIIKNVAIGTGVILVCVTVSVVTGGLGAPAVSMIFMASAKGAAIGALSGAVFSGIPAAVIKGCETGDMNEALKAGALAASEGFKWGAISGAVTGGVGKGVELYAGTKNGLTMNEVARIQQEHRNLSMSEIRNFRSYDDFKNNYREGGAFGNISRTGNAMGRFENHHMPADSVSNLPRNDGPAIKMLKEDHLRTSSYGSSREAIVYRNTQRELIKKGSFKEALKMDIADIRSKFGNKYDLQIREMLEYVEKLVKEGKINA